MLDVVSVRAANQCQIGPASLDGLRVRRLASNPNGDKRTAMTWTAPSFRLVRPATGFDYSGRIPGGGRTRIVHHYPCVVRPGRGPSGRAERCIAVLAVDGGMRTAW